MASDPDSTTNGEAPAAEEDPSSEPSGRAVLPRTRIRPTPTLLQMEAVECGAAALGSILGSYGRFVPLEELRVECGVSRDGSNAAAVMEAAQRYGLEAEAYRMEIADLKTAPMPCIVFWNFNHFLVLEGLRKHKAYLNDPAYGRTTVSAAEFDRSFSGIILTFNPGPDFKKGGKQSNIMGTLARRSKGIRIAVLFCVLAGLGLVIPGLAVPTFSRIFVDEILIGNSTRWLMPLLVGMALAGVLQMALTALQQHYLMRAATKLTITSTGRFLWHVLRLPIEFFMQRYAGEITSRISGNERIAQMLTGNLATSVIGLITAAFYAALMFWYDWILATIGVGLSLINLIVLRMVSRRRADESQRMLQESGKLMATAMGGVQNIESIKAAAREMDFFSRWAGYQAKSSIAEQKLAASTAMLGTIPLGLTLLSTALVLGVGGFRVMDGALTIGMLVAFQALLLAFNRPIHDLVHLGDVIQRLVGDMKRLDDVSNYPVDPALVRADQTEGDPTTRRLSGFLELRNVTFGYNKRQAPLLKDFSLKITPGERVALVGGSGSGKSTIAKLIAGLYDPWEGDILFDGKPREEHPRALISNSCALVDQDISFFEGTIRDNIALWDTTLPDDAIQRAAKDACIHDAITTRRGAYASTIEEGGRNFSGGQRQRLEIARALAIDPTVLIMDEATSALDAATEKIVDDNTRRRGCTCVVVAHRLSTIRDCSEIIVLEQGEVVQRGTHDDLIDIDGPYRNLIHAQ